jgi:NADH dehydrogenase FAD-containing subunit
MFGGFSVLSTHISQFLESRDVTSRPRVIVVGYGWAGSSFVNSLNKDKYSVQVISERPRRLNQPKLIHLFAATYREPPNSITVLQDTVLKIDEVERKVTSSTKSYEYDYLVVASGAEPNDFGTKGVKENCLLFKTEQDLETLKNRLTPQKPVMIAGAGPTGIELAFKLKTMNHPVTILEADKTILPGFSNQMKDLVMSLLEEKNIRVLTNSQIKSMNAKSFITSLGDVPHDDALAIWTCGVKPTQFMPTRGVADKQLMIKPNIYAIGDCVRGHGPPTAQNAKQQGRFLAEYFNSDFKKRDYEYEERGRVLDVEDRILLERAGAVVQLPSLAREIFYAFIDGW